MEAEKRQRVRRMVPYTLPLLLSPRGGSTGFHPSPVSSVLPVRPLVIPDGAISTGERGVEGTGIALARSPSAAFVW